MSARPGPDRNLGAAIGFAAGLAVSAVCVAAALRRLDAESVPALVLGSLGSVVIAAAFAVVGAAFSWPARRLGMDLAGPADAAVFGALCLALPVVIGLAVLGVRGSEAGVGPIVGAAFVVSLVGGAAGLAVSAFDALRPRRPTEGWAATVGRTRRCVTLGAALGCVGGYGALVLLAGVTCLGADALSGPSWALILCFADALLAAAVGGALGLAARQRGWELAGAARGAAFGCTCQVLTVAAFFVVPSALAAPMLETVVLGSLALVLFGLGGLLGGAAVGALARWCAHTTGPPPATPDVAQPASLHSGPDDPRRP